MREGVSVGSSGRDAPNEEYAGWDRLSLDVGLDARVRAFSPFWVSTGLTQRWIVDEGYVNVHGHAPRMAFAFIGLSFRFRDTP